MNSCKQASFIAAEASIKFPIKHDLGIWTIMSLSSVCSVPSVHLAPFCLQGSFRYADSRFMQASLCGCEGCSQNQGFQLEDLLCSSRQAVPPAWGYIL